jgi:hypothetical protein
MCRVSARRLSIYNFAWELLKATNLQAESKILKYWNIKSTNQNENFSKKKYVWYLKSVKEPNIRMEATRRNLRARLKILKKNLIAKSTNQNEIFPKKVCLVP